MNNKIDWQMNNEEGAGAQDLKRAEELVAKGETEDFEEAKKRVMMLKRLNENAERLEEKVGSLEMKDIVNDSYETIKNMFVLKNANIVPLQSGWSKIQGRNLLLRKDDPYLVIEKMMNGDEIDIGYDMYGSSDAYANAAIASDEGLKLSLSEGRKGAELNCVYVFDPEGLDVNTVKPMEYDPRDPKRYAIARAVSGTLSPNKIKYLIIRVPTSLFPENELAPPEIERIENGEPIPYIARLIEMPPYDDRSAPRVRGLPPSASTATH
ncbi:MAG: hypothetical protein AAB949_00490 [Patescibacteria group bacterium]